MKYISSFFNPIEWIRAYRFNKKNKQFDKSSYDLELYLYSKILTNDMLHYGYFEDISIKPETISLKQLEDAQIKYAENIIQQIVDKDNLILDVGCGMGGFAKILLDNQFKVEVLTPNKNQIEYINHKYKELPSHNCKFEKFNSTNQFGTIINSESLQYISLNDAFEKVEKTLLPGGRWIIVDYFRLHDKGISKSAHLLEDFHNKVKEFGWKIKHEQDITKNVLPTLKFVNMYADRFLLPIKHYAFEKLRYKKGWLYYLTCELRKFVDKKLKKERASIDPEKFVDEKKYILFVLEKT